MEANGGRGGEYIKNDLRLKRLPRISLHCKLFPVQYWEYGYDLDIIIESLFIIIFNQCTTQTLIWPKKWKQSINKEAHNETVKKILEQLREGFYKLLRVK